MTHAPSPAPQAPGRDTLPRDGGQLLVDQLLLHGADTAFCVPGESYLAVLNALYDVRERFTLINARHEAGAANMAEAYGKLTGRPGICMVTRGPGATQAAVGVHTAFQDSTPMILLIGQVDRDGLDREAFQEIDYRRMFGPVAKWAAQIERTERIPEYMARAFHVATSGRPGPVVLALPEDMLTEVRTVPDAKPKPPAQARPAPEQLQALREMLQAAERPLLLLGGSGWSDEACASMGAFAEANGLPVAAAFRRQDLIDHGSPSYVGDLSVSGGPSPAYRQVEAADLIVAVGTRLGDYMTRGYTALSVPTPRQRLAHVHADADELGLVYRPDLAIVSGTSAFAAALEGSALQGGAWFDPGRWSGWREAGRQAYLASLRPEPYEGAFHPDLAMLALADELPRDAVVTLDAGNHTGWPQRFLRFGRPGRQLGATNGSMGYAVPAAVAASLRHPDRAVVAFVGDGGFMMSGTELATAAQHGATPIVLLFDNGMYGTIRLHQEREYPGRVVGTDLVNPDFVAMAKAMGAHAERVERSEDFLPAFRRARASGRAALLHLPIDPELINTRTRLSALARPDR